MTDLSNLIIHRHPAVYRPSSSLHVAIIWQHFLPYHKARIRRLSQRLIEAGHRLTAIEVAWQDDSYGFEYQREQGDWRCAFQGQNYHRLKPEEIMNRVSGLLRDVQPDLVFAPATPFPEGMAAVSYRQKSGCRMIMMDDAWEHSDNRGALTTMVKRLIHHNIDGVFIPAVSHRSYFQHLGFPSDRIVYGVDVVDNDLFAAGADSARAAAAFGDTDGLPQRYFLFVGRYLERKGLTILFQAYRQYRMQAGDKAMNLVLVGDGELRSKIEQMAAEIGSIFCLGARFGEELLRCYGLAQALIVPSAVDPWGLVVNEGLAAGLPVIVSRGCGAAGTLVEEGGNGWTFAPENAEQLTAIMLRLNDMPEEKRREMGARSRAIISDWSLDRFADGVLQAMELPRRKPGGVVANMVTKLWKGRVSVN